MPRPGRFAATAFAAACTLLAAGAAADGPADARLVSVRAGLDGVAPPERWSPLTVTIAPGDKAQALEVVVQYRQDATQTCVLTAPVATTPGLQTTVPLLVCLPQDVGRIEVMLVRDGTAAVLDRAVMTRSPGNRELPTPSQPQSGAVMVGHLDVRLRPEVLEQWLSKADATSNYRMTSATLSSLVRIRAEDLTQTWAGLDALNCLVARQSSLDRLPAPTLDALAAWVSSGGRLVLIVDSPGSTWKRFASADVRVDDTASAPPPMALQVQGLVAGTFAERINARAMTLGPAAESLGWKGWQGFDDGGWLVTTGPFGGGLTVLVGADPTLFTATLDDAALVPYWKWLLRQATPEVGVLRENRQYGSDASGDGPAAEAALRTAVDAACDVPPVPRAVYVLVVVIAAALALAVSVGDFFILGKLNLRKRSWLTAATWTLLCAGAAWVVPNLARSRQTSLGRIAVVDAFPATGDRTPSAWRTGVTTVFAASSGDLALRDAGAPAASAPGGYWRGVSVLQNSSRVREERGVLIGDLPLRQHLSALDGSAAAVTLPDRGLPVRQWTLRTLEDQGPLASAPTIKTLWDKDHAAFDLSGLPQGSRFVTGVVQTSRGWSRLSQETPGPGTSLRLKVDSLPSSAAGTWHSAPRPDPDPDGTPIDFTSRMVNLSPPGAYLHLSGARRRTAAFDALAAGGEYAVVHFMIQGPSDLTTPAPHTTKATTIYRIAAPLPDPAAPPQPPTLPAQQP